MVEDGGAGGEGGNDGDEGDVGDGGDGDDDSDDSDRRCLTDIQIVEKQEAPLLGSRATVGRSCNMA